MRKRRGSKRAARLTFLRIRLRIGPTAAQNVAIMTIFNKRRKTDFSFFAFGGLGLVAKCRNC